MTFATDLDADIGNVFFDDFGVSVLLVREKEPSADPDGIRCIVSRGLDRIVDGGYIKNSWEIEFAVIDKVRTGDQVQILDGNGVVVSRYLVGNQADRTGETVTFAARVDK
jgi:hypothetical protein